MVSTTIEKDQVSMKQSSDTEMSCDVVKEADFFANTPYYAEQCWTNGVVHEYVLPDQDQLVSAKCQARGA